MQVLVLSPSVLVLVLRHLHSFCSSAFCLKMKAELDDFSIDVIKAAFKATLLELLVALQYCKQPTLVWPLQVANQACTHLLLVSCSTTISDFRRLHAAFHFQYA